MLVVASWQTWLDHQGVSYTAQQLTLMGGLFVLGFAAFTLGMLLVGYEGKGGSCGRSGWPVRRRSE